VTRKEIETKFFEQSLLELSLALAETVEDAIEEPLGQLLSQYVRTCKDAGKKQKPKKSKVRLTPKEKALKVRLMRQFGGMK
jgi:hypothetical protein